MAAHPDAGGTLTPRRTAELTGTDVVRARQASLGLSAGCGSTPADVVHWFGAMQAQDLASAKWSLGVRLPGTTEAEIDAAIESGRILRTWPMRGTIHLIPSADARWMLDVTGSRALTSTMRSRERLGLDPAVADQAAGILAAALSGGRRMTRSQALATLADAGIDVAGQAGYHLLGYAALVGVTCIGPQVGTEQTFVLLDDWAPDQAPLDRRDAIAELAMRFFRSHGPATVKDFAGWTGLTLSDCRLGIADNDGRLVETSFEGSTVLLTTDLADRIAEGATRGRPRTTVPPGFDEFILGYKDRTAQVPAGRMDDIVPGGNGMFRATLCVDGRVAGTWRRTLRRDRVDVELGHFGAIGERLLREAEQAFSRYGTYLGRTAVVRYLRR